jgi:DNA-binding NarL/FixJ family response regulator
VDDEPFITSMLERAFEEYFLEVRAANDAAGAIRCLREGAARGQPFLALLVDLNLGFQPGEIVIDAAERLPIRPRIVAFSGAESDSTRIVHLQQRAVFLTKAAPLSVLLDAFVPPRSQMLAFGDLHGLSARETDTLFHIVGGLSDGEIARTFGRSESAVRSYVERAADKISRSFGARVSGRQGLLASLTRFLEGRASGCYAAVRPLPATPSSAPAGGSRYPAKQRESA